jgi:hypothetical protein
MKGGGQIVKCKFCGALYRIFAYMAGDQSCCPQCRAQADRNTR